MTIYLRQSTASQEVPLGYFVDSTDGNTEKTALTIANTDIKVWKNGATTLASKNSGGATHISNGVYYAVLDATDTDTLGPLVIFVHVTGALTVRLECVVLLAQVYDSLIAGSDLLDVSAAQLNGTALTGRDIGASVLVGDKTGFSLSAAGVQAIWDALTSALTTANSIGKRLADDIDATISSRLSSVGYTAPDNATITTIANRLGAFTGTGVNTVLGFLKAMLRKDLSAPSDVAGNYDPATDSQEALRDRGDAAWITATGFSTLDAAGVRSALGLSSANLDTQLDALPTAAEIRTEMDSNSTKLANLDATMSSRATPAQVNAEVLDVLTVDTFAEVAGVPAATSTLKDKLLWLFALARNKVTQDSTTQTLRNDGDSADVATAGVSEVAGTFTRDEWS